MDKKERKTTNVVVLLLVGGEGSGVTTDGINKLVEQSSFFTHFSPCEL